VKAFAVCSQREAGYLIVHGRGRGASCDLKRDFAYRMRGRETVDAEFPLDQEGLRLRIFARLKERGQLTNAEIRRFSGFTRIQVYLPKRA